MEIGAWRWKVFGREIIIGRYVVLSVDGCNAIYVTVTDFEHRACYTTHVMRSSQGPGLNSV